MKQSPSEAVDSYCLNYFCSSRLVKAPTQVSQRGAVHCQGRDTEGLWHSSQLWPVSWLEHAAGCHKFSTEYYHLSFPSCGKKLKGQAFAQLLLFPSLKMRDYLLAQLCLEELISPLSIVMSLLRPKFTFCST